MIDIYSACCFTGHRKIDVSDISRLEKELQSTLKSLYDDGYRLFLVGGAVGFDLLVSNAVLKLKQIFNDIKLILFLPCIDYRNKWSDEDKKSYDFIDSNADEIIYVSENYGSNCMQLRDIQLVNNSSVCVSYLNKKSGGTAFTVKYALGKGIKVINLGKEKDVRFVFDPLLKDNLTLF